MAHHETLLVEAAAAGGLLTPGRVLRALALGAGVRAEEVGTLTPLGRGRVAAEIAVARAERIATPRPLPTEDAGRRALLMLRRADDAPEEGVITAFATLPAPGHGGAGATGAASATDSDGAAGELPGPGAVAAALAEALGGTFGAEDLGVGFVGARSLRLQLPARVVVGRDLPGALVVGGQTLTLSAGERLP